MNYGKYAGILYIESTKYCDYAMYFDCYKKGEWFKTTDLPRDWCEDKSEELTQEEQEIVCDSQEQFVKELKKEQVSETQSTVDLKTSDINKEEVSTEDKENDSILHK